MSKVDWSLAPSWAKGYGLIGIARIAVWFDDFRYQYLHDGRKHEFDDECTFKFSALSEIEERPKQPQAWSGPEDGLPPVGVECEVDHGNGKHWDKVTILAHHGEKAIYLDPIRGIHYIWGLLKDFRTIRTEEQLAAEQRETAIREIMDIADVDCRVTAGRLVDAGFKR